MLRAESLESEEEEDQRKAKKNPFDFDDSDTFLDPDSKWVSQTDVKNFLKQSRGIKYDDDEDDDQSLGAAWGGSEYSIPGWCGMIMVYTEELETGLSSIVILHQNLSKKIPLLLLQRANV